MRNKQSRADLPDVRRLLVAIAILAAALAAMTFVIPWTIPYDRLEHLYGLECETIEAGHPGGDFLLYCAPINGSPKVELLVNGEPYAVAECVAKERYRVTLGPELFAQPGELKLTLRETFAQAVSLRSNTTTLYVTP